jgi:hypothetical protein
MSVDGLSNLDTTNLAGPEHWHPEPVRSSPRCAALVDCRVRAHAHAKHRFPASNGVT